MAPHRSPERRRRSHRRRRLRCSHAAETSTPAPATAAASVTLPNELIFDILSRLPVRSVCQFRCVSKEWHSLISDPAFAAEHRSRHAEPLVVATCVRDISGNGHDLVLMDMDGNVVRVMKGLGGSGLMSTSVGDMICVADVSSTARGACRVIDLVTGKVAADCPKQRWTCYNIFGFGRAAASGAYKVVRLTDGYTCEVFTLGRDNGWRSSTSPPTRVFCGHRAWPVVVNGVMYLLVGWDRYDDMLLCFDLENEEWKETIQGPQKLVGYELWKTTEALRIGELNNALCMAQWDRCGTTTGNGCTNIWLLTDSNENIWIKAYMIPMAHGTFYCIPLRVTHDGNRLILHCSHFKYGELLQVYDPHSNVCTTVRKHDKVTTRIGLCSLHLDRFVSEEDLVIHHGCVASITVIL